jgi:hypothetical protein
MRLCFVSDSSFDLFLVFGIWRGESDSEGELLVKSKLIKYFITNEQAYEATAGKEKFCEGLRISCLLRQGSRTPFNLSNCHTDHNAFHQIQSRVNLFVWKDFLLISNYNQFDYSFPPSCEADEVFCLLANMPTIFGSPSQSQPEWTGALPNAIGDK